MSDVKLFDTTLRDGTQGEKVSLLMQDKLTITNLLDDMGIHYIEGGWPGSNPKDEEYFLQAKKLKLKQAKVTAFGSTRRAKLKPEDDPSIQALVASEVPAIAIFGKTWDMHVIDALKIDLEKNLEIIFDSVRYLKNYTDELFYDAEHTFDGYKGNPEYALKTIQAAIEGGADNIVLCDTNGGTITWELEKIIEDIKQKFPGVPLGIHAHNDSGLATANTLTSVRCGITQVQGTFNGYGERCANADLTSVIPNLKLKMNIDCISDENLKKITFVSKKIDEIFNLPHNSRLPYVGDSAFAHKGGIHVSAVLRNPQCYEHVNPEVVGNKRRALISDLSGMSNIVYKAKEMGIEIDKDTVAGKKTLEEIKKLENQGFYFETADASFELMLLRNKGEVRDYFELLSYRVIDGRKKVEDIAAIEATVMVRVGKEIEHTASVGNGPVNALDYALRKALLRFYPSLETLKLLDYKVRILLGEKGTAATVRVLITSGDEENRWETVGVATDVIDASRQALIDAVVYKLMKDDGLASLSSKK